MAEILGRPDQLQETDENKTGTEGEENNLLHIQVIFFKMK